MSRINLPIFGHVKSRNIVNNSLVYLIDPIVMNTIATPFDGDVQIVEFEDKLKFVIENKMSVTLYNVTKDKINIFKTKNLKKNSIIGTLKDIKNVKSKVEFYSK